MFNRYIFDIRVVVNERWMVIAMGSNPTYVCSYEVETFILNPYVTFAKTL